MPSLSKNLEFYNPWTNKNTHTTQVGIVMPQMVNGQRPIGPLTLWSEKVPGASYYKLGERLHTVTYTVEGAFRGTCSIEVSFTPAPTNESWTTLTNTVIFYTGRETTGGAGISGGFSGAVSKPAHTDMVQFLSTCSWVRAKLDISQGTLQAISLNF